MPEASTASGPLPIDVQRLRRRLAAARRLHGDLRFKRAVFRVPWPLDDDKLQKALNKALDTWVAAEAKRGWTLRGKPRVFGSSPAYGTVGDWYNAPLLDQREVQVIAAFSTDAKPVRIELEVATG